jgi:hypothetical protein
LVRPGYFISPVPTITGEHSPIRHLETPDGRAATPHGVSNIPGLNPKSFRSAYSVKEYVLLIALVRLMETLNLADTLV